MSVVAAYGCGSYDSREVEAAVTRAVETAGGLAWVVPGMRVAVKVNLLTGRAPEAAVTTHPTVVAAVAKLLLARGAVVTVGDSPSGPMTAARLEEIYTVTGMKELEALGVTLNRDLSVTELPGKAPGEKPLHCCGFLAGADAIVDVCKLKTHAMMGMTAAVKNMYGAVPGVTKAEYHVKYSGDERFAHMLIQLYERLRPRLALVDAVVGMEGNGPGSGTPRQVGLIAASQSGYALDEFLAQVIAIDPTEVPTLIAARKARLVTLPVQVVGDASELRIPDYQLIHRRMGASLVGIITGRAPKKQAKVVPQVAAAECVGCGACARVCPRQAIEMREGLPVIDRKRCVRCFCCQELCPKGAMKAVRPGAREG